ncbi:MAG: inositol monophosphatase [Ignavibacteriae bacterium]|nr:inositol monophosphatase [Ignavibacteriota bacterium]
MNTMQTSDFLHTAIEAARAAGHVLTSHLGALKHIEAKQQQRNNLVTEADRASEHIIRDILLGRFPTHSLLGEEGGAVTGTGEYRWIVDPLDGTTNFTHGLSLFSVSIAVERAGEVLAGVVYDPMADELFAAERGSGAYLNDRKLQVSGVRDIQDAMLVTGFPYTVRENPEFCRERFVAFLHHAQAIRRLGSAALDCAYVAAGRIDGYWEVALQAWDKAAGMLLIEEAGGRVTTFDGGPLELFHPPFLGSNGHIHDVMLDILAKARDVRIQIPE